MNKWLLLLLLYAGHALALVPGSDLNFTPDGKGVSNYYMMEGGVSHDLNHITFEPTKPQALARDKEQLSPQVKAKMDTMYESDPNNLSMILLDHGTIVYERNKDVNTQYLGWSLAKGVTNLLVGQALCRGDIKSLSDTAESYAPELKNNAYGRATIAQLLSMTSGAPGPDRQGTGENPGDFWLLSKQFRSQLDLINNPKNLKIYEHDYTYDNLNTSALGLVLDHLKGTEYYMRELVNKSHTEQPMDWFRDKDNRINTSYGLSASLTDWAHLAQYSLDTIKGSNGKCLQEYMLNATHTVVKPEETTIYFGYGTGVWTHPVIKNGYVWLGMYGQKAWVDPNHELVLILFRNRHSEEFNNKLGQAWGNWRQDTQSQNAAVQGSVTVQQAPKK